MSKDSFLISVIDISLDPQALVQDCLSIVDNYIATYGGEIDVAKPFSIILTENENFPESKNGLISYDSVHNTAYFDRKNQATLKPEYAETALAELVPKLPFPFSIMRLSVLPPQTIIGMHTDESCHAQIAIRTNQDCFVAARTGETAHVPVDGKLYIISTTIPHTAYNASSELRTHLSISIFDEDYVQILRKSQAALD